jgi:hypothetical protein
LAPQTRGSSQAPQTGVSEAHLHLHRLSTDFQLWLWPGFRGGEAWDLRRGHLDFAFSVTLNKQIQLALARRGLEARLDVDALVCDTDIAKLDDWRNAVQHTQTTPQDARARAPRQESVSNRSVSATGVCQHFFAPFPPFRLLAYMYDTRMLVYTCIHACTLPNTQAQAIEHTSTGGTRTRGGTRTNQEATGGEEQEPVAVGSLPPGVLRIIVDFELLLKVVRLRGHPRVRPGQAQASCSLLCCLHRRQRRRVCSQGQGPSAHHSGHHRCSWC